MNKKEVAIKQLNTKQNLMQKLKTLLILLDLRESSK